MDNGNWWKLFLKHRNLIRISIIINVLKLLVCRTSFLGYHHFVCPQCNRSLKVPHTCKSRFCSSCGKKATDDWIKTHFNKLPHTIWQHISFTMPQELWDFFWVNRYLMNKIPPIAAGIIKELSLQIRCLPGIFLVLHTFGRDLKRNIHIHLSTTIGGLSTCLPAGQVPIREQIGDNSWVKGRYFYHGTLKKMWRFRIIDFLRKEFKAGRLKLPSHLNHIKSYETFVSWTSQFYEKTWVVHLNKQTDNIKVNVEYLGKYLKRPPIGETRILAYSGHTVTYKYLDHYTDTVEVLTLPVMDFISRLISHIPDTYFRNIRYYGFLSNRLSGKLLPIVYELLKMKRVITTKVYTSWGNMISRCFNYNPLKCPRCNILMVLREIILPRAAPILSMHKEIAHGYFPLV